MHLELGWRAESKGIEDDVELFAHRLPQSASVVTGMKGRQVFRFSLMLAAAAAILVLAACGDEGEGEAADTASQEISHVHGLGVNPADGALFIATHSGLFRSQEGTTDAERVDQQYQDTMGFTVVGPDHFLGSGHPAPGEDRPPNLGLIKSTDSGQSWREVSLAGEADFHVLRYAHERVYAYNGLSGVVMLSDNGGHGWIERRPPGSVIDLAVDPDDPQRIIVSTERGLAISSNDGRTWRPLDGAIGLLAWPREDTLYLIDAQGRVQVTSGPEGGWKEVGSIGGQPAALTAADAQELYAALADATVKASSDGGVSWEVRTSP